jgi:hypothetical protein
MQKIYPLPEAIDGHIWSIEHGPGSCNTVDRVLRVPMTQSDSDRHVRNHELGHSAITPRHPASVLARKYAISMDSLQVCEDARVHRFLEHCGIERPGVMSQGEMDQLVDRSYSNPRDIALLLIAALRTDDYGRAINSLRTRVSPEKLAEITTKVRLIDKRMDSARLLFRPIGFKQATAPAAKLLDALFLEETNADDKRTEILADLIRCEQLLSKRRSPVKWGTLEIRNLPASMSRITKPMSSHRIFRDEGAALMAPYRLPVDGRVFVRHKKIPGGTVLIDGSGSMNLRQEHLAQILAHAPAATIGLYSGKGKKGVLSVVASKGRVVDGDGLKKAEYGSGNVVDGPALRWLATQASPRCWVSDGFVTGQNDRPSIDLFAEAAILCKEHSITRVDKASAVGGFLKRTAK